MSRLHLLLRDLPAAASPPPPALCRPYTHPPGRPRTPSRLAITALNLFILLVLFSSLSLKLCLRFLHFTSLPNGSVLLLLSILPPTSSFSSCTLRTVFLITIVFILHVCQGCILVCLCFCNVNPSFRPISVVFMLVYPASVFLYIHVFFQLFLSPFFLL